MFALFTSIVMGVVNKRDGSRTAPPRAVRVRLLPGGPGWTRVADALRPLLGGLPTRTVWSVRSAVATPVIDHLCQWGGRPPSAFRPLLPEAGAEARKVLKRGRSWDSIFQSVNEPGNEL